MLLFPAIRGSARLVFELPIQVLGVYAWYRYLYSLPPNGRNFVLSAFGNLFGAIAILCILAYQCEISYLRNRLPVGADFSSRLALLVPGRVLADYKAQHGNDLAVKVIRGLALAALVTFSLGLFLSNRGRIYP